MIDKQESNKIDFFKEKIQDCNKNGLNNYDKALIFLNQCFSAFCQSNNIKIGLIVLSLTMVTPLISNYIQKNNKIDMLEQQYAIQKQINLDNTNNKIKLEENKAIQALADEKIQAIRNINEEEQRQILNTLNYWEKKNKEKLVLLYWQVQYAKRYEDFHMNTSKEQFKQHISDAMNESVDYYLNRKKTISFIFREVKNPTIKQVSKFDDGMDGAHRLLTWQVINKEKTDITLIDPVINVWKKYAPPIKDEKKLLDYLKENKEVIDSSENLIF